MAYNFNVKKITSLTDERISKYISYNEKQLAHIYEPQLGVFICESAKVIKRALKAGYKVESFLIEENYLCEDSTSEAVKEVQEVLKEVQDETSVQIFSASKEVLSQIKGYVVTRGMLCIMRRKNLPEFENLIADNRRIVVLESVVNPTNIGSVFRSAAALGIDSIVLTNDSCDPLYKRSARVSMGTVFQIPWTFIPKEGYIDKFHELGYKVVALALKEESKDITDPIFAQQEKLAIIMGNEGNGISQDSLEKCDYVIKIPMYHGVDSLNVAAASAVAFWELRVK